MITENIQCIQGSLQVSDRASTSIFHIFEARKTFGYYLCEENFKLHQKILQKICSVLFLKDQSVPYRVSVVNVHI